MSKASISPHFFQMIFETNPVGLVVVDSNISIQSINNYMFSIFNIDQKDFHERMFGNALRCSDIYLTGKKCGEGENCNDCTLRKILNSAMLKGVSIPETVIEHDFIINGVSRKKWFKVSASRFVIEDEIFGVLSFVDITYHMEYEELLNSQLSLDAATGLMNKYALVDSLKSLATGKNGFTLAMIDIDNFKSVNDQYGHLTGDKVLNLFCSAIFTNTRKQDIIGRFGGDEFMLVFHGTVTCLLIKALQRISTSFRTTCMNELGFSPTFSAGVTEFSAENVAGMSVDAIITEADEYLYVSKEAGKNRVTASGISLNFNS